MPALAVRERLASLGRLTSAHPRTAVQRRLPSGFEPVSTPYGVAWRWLDLLPRGRVAGPEPPPHVYLDTETTGLSGGTGTQVFAAAICRPVAAGLELTQLFLADPSAEAAFLHLLSCELARVDGLVTYNGTRFDLPLLRTRWVMTRMEGELTHPGHRDLLTMTRALWRHRLEACSLRVVEERMLHFEREADLPGRLVPEAYFGYLRTGWSRCLEAALEHNRQDTISLYYLHCRLLLWVEGGDPGMESPDWLALGRYLLRSGRAADGWAALRRAAQMADSPEAARAGLLLARTLARRRRYAAAERLLGTLQARVPEEAALATARAALLEWRLGDLPAARDVVSEALSRLGSSQSPPSQRLRNELERRLVRLESRLRCARGRLRAPRIDSDGSSGSHGETHSTLPLPPTQTLGTGQAASLLRRPRREYIPWP